MKLKIIGSGGCTSIPTPTCNCSVCMQAREKGFPYARTGCSLFIEDINFLIDTPEDIKCSLLNAKINKIDAFSISHSDPDHTRGVRIFEEMNINWVDKSKSKSTPLFALPEVWDDVNKWMFNTLDYYSDRIKVIEKNTTQNPIILGDIKITMVHNFPIIEGKRKPNVCVYIIEQGDKKVIYAPCDCKPFYENELYRNADVLILGTVIPSNVIKNNEELNPEHSLLTTEMNTISEVEQIMKKLNIKKTVVTHIEELWGKSYDDYKELEKSLNNIQFAYNGMIIEI